MENISEDSLKNISYDEMNSDMKGLLSLLYSFVLMFVSVESDFTTQPNIVTFLGQSIQKEVLTIKQPIDETLAGIGSASSGAAISLGRSIQKEAQTVKQPVDLTVSYVGSSQCSNVKKLFGVSYEQLQGEREPDLNDLALVYQTATFTTTINMKAAAESLQQARTYDKDEKLIIFLHGFTDSTKKDNFQKMVEVFLKKGSTSMLGLDASVLLRWLYIRASTYVRHIGEKLGEIMAAVCQKGQDPAKIHLIGHSLGAHIAGFAGKTFWNMTGQKIGRITALDPAGPCFTHVEPDLKVKETDAVYLDAIHTDAGIYGITESVGKKDYRPNSGTMQPNCFWQTCSHSRCVDLFVESVSNPTAFPAVRCKDWDAFKKGDCDSEISYMGYGSKPGNATGNYFLQTSGDSPYSLGADGIKYTNTDGVLKNIGNVLG